MRTLRTLINNLIFAECPRWHDGRLYVSDFFAHQVLSIDSNGVAETVAHVPKRPAGLGFLPDGRMLIVSMRDRLVLCRGLDGSLTVHADLSSLAPWDLNDMVVDSAGRAWIGSFGFDFYGGSSVRSTVLLCVEPDGSPRVVADGLGFPNGMAVTPDGRTLIVAETMMNRLTAFDILNGAPVRRRTWAVFGDVPTATRLQERLGQLKVAADGICLDAEGAAWVADPLHGRLLRVAEGGRILEELSGAGLAIFGCTLGGDDGRTLFACGAPTFVESECIAKRQSAIIQFTVDVPHAGLP